MQKRLIGRSDRIGGIAAGSWRFLYCAELRSLLYPGSRIWFPHDSCVEERHLQSWLCRRCSFVSASPGWPIKSATSSTKIKASRYLAPDCCISALARIRCILVRSASIQHSRHTLTLRPSPLALDNDPDSPANFHLPTILLLGFGTMIGTGWVVLMDDWLGRGGPLGAMLGFGIGGLLLLPVGYIYGQWVRRLPDAAGEAAYTAQVFPPFISYLTGWIMLLAYFIVCPWEAVAVGKLAAYIFPQLDTVELYRVAGQPVFFPRLLLGYLLTVFLAYLNYRGIRASATFQSWATSAVLLVFLCFCLPASAPGRPTHFQPFFSHAPLASILLTLQIVPYFVTGFESVPKVAEEANPDFLPKDFFKAIAMALLVGAAFLRVRRRRSAYIAPWQGLLGHSVCYRHCV